MNKEKLMTTIEDVLNSIKSLAETQEKGNREVNQKFKALAKIREKDSAEVSQKIRELAETQRKNEEIRRKSSAEVDQKFKELAESREKSSAEVDQKFKELAESREKSSAEVDQKFKESEESRKELQKTLNKFIGESGLQWGRFIETLMDTGAINLLQKRGIQVEMTSTRVKDKNPSRYEIDILAVNGKEIVAIEAKKYLRKRDVDEAIKRFKTFKQYNREASQKILYGAVAYLECEKHASFYAEQKGLFVFQVTGNSATMNNSQDFQPDPLLP